MFGKTELLKRITNLELEIIAIKSLREHDLQQEKANKLLIKAKGYYPVDSQIGYFPFYYDSHKPVIRRMNPYRYYGDELDMEYTLDVFELQVLPMLAGEYHPKECESKKGKKK